MLKPIESRRHLRASAGRCLLWFSLSLLPAGFPATTMAQSSLSELGAQNLDRLLGLANIIYLGTVTGTNASSVPGVPASEATVLTRIDSALTTPAALAPLDGRTVTLISEDGKPPALNQRFIFFTQTSLVGKEIALREIGRLSIEAADDLRRQIQGSDLRLEDERLSKRLSAVDAVAIGRITAIDTTVPPPQVPVTEHDPQWQRATLEISTVLSGDLRDRPVTLLFPGTLDVAWVDAPRPSAQQEAVWLLTFNRDVDGYTALDPLDVQPVEQADRIRRLIGDQR
ncbi:hypothetical protein [Allomesorhizobium camelthorni]|uniref:DUF2092 domain-containing protein n=1 Tax=Allomesorhizobium camelthorni TaxID=475069 RepID=A0A6G4WMQ0_9HYPH|nr:hypothetical protein [Mesorhizobium camelthorni]NGO55486.1 hypothetical protein [Mesorhizobium camelthorni]